MKVKVFLAVIGCLIFSPSFADLTGTWTVNGGAGKYYIKQIGEEIWWYGESSSSNPLWSNSAHGKYSSGTVTLEWADVPKGSIANHGILVLQVSNNDTYMESVIKTGGFGGSSVTYWTKD